jgi:hypothetical protein
VGVVGTATSVGCVDVPVHVQVVADVTGDVGAYEKARAVGGDAAVWETDAEATAERETIQRLSAGT